MRGAPRLPLWLVTRCLPSSIADDVSGDLEERWRKDAVRSRVAATWRLTRVALIVSTHGLIERTRGGRGPMLDGLRLDARHALRMLRRQPVASGAVVVTLALAIGGSTALFSVVNAWVLKPLPFANPERLVVVWETIPSAGIYNNTPAPAVLALWRNQARSFDGVAAMTRGSRNLTGRGEPERLSEIRAEAALLGLLGLRPELGRLFIESEGQAPAPPVVLLSHAAWQGRFDGTDDVVGELLVLDGVAHEVVGVLPRDARPLGIDADIWTPLAFTSAEWASENRFLWVFGRVREGLAIKTVSAEVDRLAMARTEEGGTGGRAVSLTVETVGETASEVIILFGASLFVLVVACANIASLTLAQIMGRRREMLARQALGASRGRLVRQVLIESLTVGAIGGAAGLAVAVWATRAVLSLAPASTRLGGADVFDLRVFGFAMALTAATSLVFGLLPAWHAGRLELASELRAGGRSVSNSRRRAMSAIVSGEIAVTVVLLVAAALVARSFLQLTAVDLGFEPSSLVLAEVPRPDGGDAPAFFAELERRLADAPGVESVALSQAMPLISIGSFGGGFVVETAQDQDSTLAYWRSVNPDYFRALAVPMLSGRALTADDRAGAPRVAVVSESFARRAWPDGNGVGRRIGWGSFEEPMTVVGIAADVRQSRSGSLSPHVYMPYSQVDFRAPSHVAVRTSLDVSAAADVLRSTVASIDRGQPVEGIQSADQLLWESMGRRRFHLILFGLLSSIATCLALLGLYALLSSALSERRRDLGIRAALGATPGRLRLEWWRHGLTLIALGLAIGIAASLALGRVVEGFLFGVEPADPVALASGALLVFVTASLACWVPARRAARVNPIETLQAD